VGLENLLSSISAEGARVLNAADGRSKALLMKLEWGQQLLLLVMQQKVKNFALVFVWVCVEGK
jgi:hypothetical protein